MIEDSFIRFDHKKSIVIDYDGVSDESSFLKVEIYFEASGNFDLDWYFKGDKIQIREETDNDLSLKFISKYAHVSFDSMANYARTYPIGIFEKDKEGWIKWYNENKCIMGLN